MNRARLALIVGLISVSLAIPAVVDAHGHRSPHAGAIVVPPIVRVHGQSLRRVATDWTAWAFEEPAATNPGLNGLCERDSGNRKVWFLAFATAEGETTANCTVPKGAYVLVSGPGWECSKAEGNGDTPAALRACTRERFASEIAAAQIIVDGHRVPRLKRFILTTRAIDLPADNFWGAEAGPSMTKGYFLLVKMTKPGTHTIESIGTFSDGTILSLTHEITVVPK